MYSGGLTNNFRSVFILRKVEMIFHSLVFSTSPRSNIHVHDNFCANYVWVLDNIICASQGCGLGKITRCPKVPNHEILGAQHLRLYEKSKFFQSPKDKRQWPVAFVHF